MLFLAMSHWQLGEQDKARTFYRQALQWMEKNKSVLKKDQWRWQELRRFQSEAAQTLAIEENSINRVEDRALVHSRFQSTATDR